MTAPPNWCRTARLVRVVDGDTLVVDIDLGFGIVQRHALRLAGVNCPELPTEPGLAAKAAVESQLAGADRLVVETVRDRGDKYGRYLATVYYGSESLNAWLLASGLAKEMR